MSVLAWVGIALLGGVGAVARFWLAGAVWRRTSGPFPTGTLAVNLSGALALGVLAGADLSGDARLLAGTGLLGAYTTFSTWMVESLALGAGGRRRAAAANVAGSLALGLAAVAIGRAVG